VLAEGDWELLGEILELAELDGDWLAEGEMLADTDELGDNEALGL
jgi:hypothetical protein